MKAISVCPQCQYQTEHEVDHNGQAYVRCHKCFVTYAVQQYQVRAKGGRRDRSSGLKNYSIRVKEPDKDETLLQFVSDKEIEMRSGDWICGSFSEGKLKYLVNQTIKKAWDVQPPPPAKNNGCLGCMTIPLMIIIILFLTVTLSIFH
jgi:hypothetical protein